MAGGVFSLVLLTGASRVPEYKKIKKKYRAGHKKRGPTTNPLNTVIKVFWSNEA
jgi:hypothetical protein